MSNINENNIVVKIYYFCGKVTIIGLLYWIDQRFQQIDKNKVIFLYVKL